MSYRLTTTSTFASSTLEDQRFPTAADAWSAAALDYLGTDAGIPEEELEQGAKRLAAGQEPATVALPTGESITVAEEPDPEPLNLPAPLGAGQLDADGLRALAPQLRAQLIDSIRQAATELRANRGTVVYPEDTYDLVRRLTAAGESLRMVGSSFDAAAREADALTEEEALTALGENDGALAASLFVPDGEGQRIAVRADWKPGDSTWDVQTLARWLVEDETQNTLSSMARRAPGTWEALSPEQRKEVAAAIADTGHDAIARLLDLGNFTPGAKKVEALRKRYAEQQKDDVAALLRGIRSQGLRRYLGVKITREQA